VPPGPIDLRFLKNSIWSIIGVGANVLVGIVLSPYMVRLLGAERFGVWALVFSVLDYFWLFDLGLTPAIANLVTRALAKNDSRRINEVINTATVCFLLIAGVIWSLTFLFGAQVVRIFRVPAPLQHEFTLLIYLTGLSWGACVVLQMYVAALDAFQRFDLTNRVTLVLVVTRSVGYVVALLLGGGLLEMGVIFVSVQILGSLWHLRNFARVFRELHYSLRLVRVETMREILRYGLPAFAANASSLFLAQSAPPVIGHYLQTAFVGFFAMPTKLVQNLSDTVSRLSLVTRSRVAELDELQDQRGVADLVVLLNRYCYSLYMPLLIFVSLFGRQLLTVWLGRDFATHSAPLLPILIAANAIVLGGQYNSAAALFGLGEHRRYAVILTCEGVALFGSLLFVVPAFGIAGAAWTVSILMVVFRGLLTPALLCRTMKISFGDYLRRIYLRPTVTAGIVMAGAIPFTHLGLRGDSWMQLIAAGLLISLLFVVMALFTCLPHPHRRSVFSMASRVFAVAASRA
jgi:O-antigen/teichoic acid export membrane protein